MTAVIRAILFDLDDTLLGNNVERFMRLYFKLLADYARPLLPDANEFLTLLMGGTQAMIANTDPQHSNRDVFWSYFSSRSGLDADEIETFFMTFYREQFPRLQAVTHTLPDAAPMLRACLQQGRQVVIATNPLFPRLAIEARLAWAGLPVAKFPFALVTTYENMHAAKPQIEYYQEILARIDVPPAEALMVGDSWENDIEPAGKLGIAAFWITPANAGAQDAAPQDWPPLAGQGDLRACRTYIENLPLSTNSST